MNKIEPLEIKQAILDVINDGIISIGKAQRIFPYTMIEIRLHAPDGKARSFFQAAFVDSRLLETAIHDHLTPPRCEETRPLIEIVLVERLDDDYETAKFQICFHSGSSNAGDLDAYLEVLEGLANHKQVRLQHINTFIGRCEHAEVTPNKILRKNDLFFLDSREKPFSTSEDVKNNEAINQSVSRTHARISFSEKDSCYYVYDDGSSKGTSLMRGGRGIAEPVHRDVGKELRNGDVLCLGRARIKFKLVQRSRDSQRTT